MTNYRIKKNAQRLINYIELIDTAKKRIENHKKTAIKYSGGWFGDISEHYKHRIEVNQQIVIFLEKRIINILNNINK